MIREVSCACVVVVNLFQMQMLKSSVPPVTMHSDVFCIICSFVMFVMDAISNIIVKVFVLLRVFVY